MLPALETKPIDGFATSLPFTTQAVRQGQRDHAGERRDATRPTCCRSPMG